MSSYGLELQYGLSCNLVKLAYRARGDGHRDGAEPLSSSSAQLADRIASDIARWRKVVSEAQVRIE